MVSWPVVLIEPANTSSPGGFVLRHALAGQHRDVDRRLAGQHDAIDRHLATRLDHHHITDLQLAGQDPLLDPVAQAPTPAGEYLDQLAQFALGTGEDHRLQALAEQADEHHLGGDQRFADEDGGDASDGQRQVRAQSALEQRLQRAVQHPRSTQDRRDQRVAIAIELGRPTARVLPEPPGHQRE
jgi:hypothetical protein